MKKKVLAMLLGMVLLVTGCGGQENTPQNIEKESGTKIEQGSISEIADIQEQAVFDGTIETGSEEMFAKRDYKVEYDAGKAVLIQLNGDSAVCDAAAVKVDGSTITIQDEGTYVFRGSLEDGRIVVDAQDSDKLQLVLEDVSINSENSAPIAIMQADKVFVTLAAGTTNTLSNGGSFAVTGEDTINAVIFSKDDLTLNGLGSLLVTSPAGHGIMSKDDLVITSGAYTIECASHGLDANDSVRLINAAFVINAGKDGIHAENKEDAESGYVYIESGSYQINAAGDGIAAGSTLQIEDGNFEITAGGGSENATKEHSEDGDMFGGGMGPNGGKPGADRKPESDQGGNPKYGAGMHPQQGMEPGQGPSTKQDTGFGQDIEPQQGMEFGQGINPKQGEEPSQSIEPQGEMLTTTEDDNSTSMKGLKATANLTINNGSFHINSADDAVHSNEGITIGDGAFEIAAGDDAFHADKNLTIETGNINILESYEGLEALHITVNGGNIQLAASDDGLNAAGGMDQSGMGGPRNQDKFGGFGGDFGSVGNGSIQINGGSLYINASGDGIDVNGSLEITGGETIVCGPTKGDTAVLDYDSSAMISGGIFIGTGATQMAQTFSDSTQGVIAINAKGQSAGSQITLTDKTGNIVLECTPKLDFSLLILSSPDMVKGETYIVTIGENSEEFTAN